MFKAFLKSRVRKTSLAESIPVNRPYCKANNLHFVRICPLISKSKLISTPLSHHPSSPQSTRALVLLKKSLTDPYPPGEPHARPLDFDLEVVESVPTADQVPIILSYLPSKNQSVESAFISSHPTSSDASTGRGGEILGELMEKNVKAVKWPIVVDWTGGRASIGDVDGVKAMLDAIRKEQK